MIKNERQYRITRTQAERFARTLEGLTSRPAGADGMHPMIAQAQVDAVSSQLADLEAELREYEAVRDGRFEVEALRVRRRPAGASHQGPDRSGTDAEGAGGPVGIEGAADTAVRGHGLRHGQMVPHQGGGGCAQHGSRWLGPGCGDPPLRPVQPGSGSEARR